MKKKFPIILASIVLSLILWISVSLSKEYYATLGVPLSLKNFPPGYTSGTELPESILLKLKGIGWKLLGVNLSSDFEYNVSAAYDSGKIFADLYNSLPENSWISSDLQLIDISPDTISFYVERVISKKLPVKANLNLNFKDGYGLATDYHLVPGSTIVYGPRSIVRYMKYAETEKKDFVSLSGLTTAFLSLKEITGVTYSNESIRADFDVQRIVEREFSNVDVKIKGVPPDREVVLIPSKINVLLQGGIDILGRIDKSVFNIYVNYRDVVLDTLGSVKPILTVPQNTEFINTKPERLRYIIKKF